MVEKMKNAPAPWTAEFGEVYSVIDQHGGRIAIATNLKGRNGLGGRRSSQEVADNARLIAAAPESHAANVEFVRAMDIFCRIKPSWSDDRIYDELPSSELAHAYFAARNAVAKAKGEQT